MRQVANNRRTALLGLCQPIGRQQVLAAGWQDAELSGRFLRRRAGGGPVRHLAHGGHQGRVPERRPGPQELLGLIARLLGGKLFQAIAGQDDGELLEVHTEQWVARLGLMPVDWRAAGFSAKRAAGFIPAVFLGTVIFGRDKPGGSLRTSLRLLAVYSPYLPGAGKSSRSIDISGCSGVN